MDGTIRTADEHPVRFDLLTENPVYKPFRYPWAYEAWLTQQRVHWLPEEVPLADDVKDWHRNLNDSERNLLTQIFRFFQDRDDPHCRVQPSAGHHRHAGNRVPGLHEIQGDEGQIRLHAGFQRR